MPITHIPQLKIQDPLMHLRGKQLSTKSMSTSMPASLIGAIWYDSYPGELPLAEFVYIEGVVP